MRLSFSLVFNFPINLRYGYSINIQSDTISLSKVIGSGQRREKFLFFVQLVT